MEQLLSLYIRSEAFILIPAIYFIGLILEQTPRIPKWLHAWAKLAFSITACLLYFGFEITSIVQGILVTGAEMIFRDIIDHTIVGNLQKRKDKNNKK